ncbi:PQ loop repeat-domain-containing protein, partial [Kalaharituber pfeilii]
MDKFPMDASPLPDHCSPSHQYLVQLSILFQTCIPTPLSLVSSVLGLLSITSWLFSQIPQLVKNYKNQSVEGLSPLFLLNWFLGDICNFIGAIILNQMFFQQAIGAYYVSVDFILMAQFLYYGVFGMGRKVLGYIEVPAIVYVNDEGKYDERKAVIIEGLSLSPPESGPSSLASSYASSSIDETKKKRAYSNGSGIGMGRNAAQAVFMFATLVALTKDVSPFASVTGATIEDNPSWVHESNMSEDWLNVDAFGVILSWVSTSLYCTSRIPQLYKNYTRRSTSGLSIMLFVAAFFGNLFYSTSLLTNPLGWSDYEPYGGGGIAGPKGSKRAEWWAKTLPFFLGASGVLLQDGMIFIQWFWYGEEDSKVVVT